MHPASRPPTATTDTASRDMIMNDINVNEPVRATPELAQVIARMLSAPGSYPGTTAEEVTRKQGKPLADGRNIIGMFAAVSIQDAPEEGALAPDSDGIMGLVTS